MVVDAARTQINNMLTYIYHTYSTELFLCTITAVTKPRFHVSFKYGPR